jgi:hypothetical protein
LLVELVMVSISPVPKLEPGPVSYFQLADTGDPAEPAKPSLNTVENPGGGPGTVVAAAGPASVTAAATAAATSVPMAVTKIRTRRLNANETDFGGVSNIGGKPPVPTEARSPPT